MLPALSSILALACAALIGFAAHRASLCNVRAMVEVLSSGTAHMLGSLMQAVLWAALLGGVVAVGFRQTLPGVPMPRPETWSLVGGWLFGVGAAINGGCSLSTLHRLADGELGMLATLSGFMVGTALWSFALLAFSSSLGYVPVASGWLRWPDAGPWLLGLLGIWAALRLLSIQRLRQASAGMGWAEVAKVPRYHFAVSAALMGLAAGMLYTTQGTWSYTGFLRLTVASAGSGGQAPSLAHALSVLALLAGMWVSASMRGSVAWRRPPGPGGWLRHGTGGALMGLGAAQVPGGNDTILLNALPTLALQAAGAYLAMLVGIATVWWLMKLAHVPMAPVVCTSAGCSDGGGAART